MQRRSPGSETITAARTLKATESGLLIVAGAVDLKVTLPAWQEGLYFDFYVKTVSATTGLQIDPVAADKINAGTANKDWINTAATDVAGDSCRVVAGSVANEWWVVNQRGTWAAEA